MSADQFSSPLVSRDVRRRLDRAAGAFDQFDFVHRHTREGLLTRLAPMQIDARCIVDLGSATGASLPLLARRYRHAQLLSIDLSRSMLERQRQWRRRLQPGYRRTAWLQGDARELPLATNSADLVFANLLLPWTEPVQTVYAQVARVLREGGLFVFATLGPDSLCELRDAWGEVDDELHVSEFPDMHDLGDGLLRAGLADAVLDTDRLNIRYENVAALFKDLTGVGARNNLAQRRDSWTGKERFARMQRALTGKTGTNAFELTLEIVYGHCWSTGASPQQQPTRIDPASIPIRARS